jgi:hypothetical protein
VRREPSQQCGLAEVVVERSERDAEGEVVAHAEDGVHRAARRHRPHRAVGQLGRKEPTGVRHRHVDLVGVHPHQAIQ